ncbi:MAG: DNRLRE domain-containing protein [Candidatus Portnoybacteria bacterium]|nr:DNRLRE domain-containing protein [Candidatus Portnoybacteria bacterium]
MKFLDSIKKRESFVKPLFYLSAGYVYCGAGSRKKLFSLIKKSSIKIAVFTLILSLSWAGLFSVNRTFGYLYDSETSLNNSFEAGILDLALVADPWMAESAELNLMPDDSVTRNIAASNSGFLPFQYNASTTIFGGDLDLCQALELKVEIDNVEIYNGNLMDFNSSTSSLSFFGSENWLYTLTLPFNVPDSLQNKTCQFKFGYSAWQENFLNSLFGFSDIEEVLNTVQTGAWLVLETETNQYRPIADAYIDQQSTGPNPNADQNFGNGTNLIIQARNNRSQRTFIRFDFRFPSDTIINSSLLNAYMYSAPTDNSRTYEARRALADWTELGITWNNQPLASTTITATVSSGDNTPQWLAWNVLSDVQSFSAGSSTNYGWRLGDSNESENEESQIARFYSRQASANAALRPYLDVNFSVPSATTTHLVVNEVYYDVAPDKGDNTNNEWVEIYNPTNSAIDISGWQICDNTLCDVIPASPPIPAKGFAVIANNASTWNTYWSMPAGAVKIALGSEIGNGLSNSPGDRLILKDALSATIDALSYGNDISQLSPAVPLSLIGNSLARIVKGYDNDSSSDWVILAAPNPGTNPSGQDGLEIMRFTSDGVLVASSKAELESLVIENLEEVSEQAPEQKEPEIEEEIIQEVPENLTPPAQDDSVGETQETTETENSASEPLPQGDSLEQESVENEENGDAPQTNSQEPIIEDQEEFFPEESSVVPEDQPVDGEDSLIDESSVYEPAQEEQVQESAPTSETQNQAPEDNSQSAIEEQPLALPENESVAPTEPENENHES